MRRHKMLITIFVVTSCFFLGGESSALQECGDKSFQCGDGSCIPIGHRCDGVKQCQKGEDENNCLEEGYCLPSSFKCQSGLCISDDQVCNGVINCPSGEDEKECGLCPTGKFECLNGQCVHGYQVCNGRNDCSTGEDEKGCGSLGAKDQCKLGEYRCPNGDCILDEAVCDGHYNCTSFEDETNCAPCITGEFECKNRKCIHGYQVCDKSIDCSTGEDEVDCQYLTTTIPRSSPKPSGTPIGVSTHKPISTHIPNIISKSRFVTGEMTNCTEFQYECIDGTCIDESYVCDSYPDCSEGEDEDCSPTFTETTSISPSTPIPVTTTKPPFFIEKTTKCSDHEYECIDGKCINKDLACDGNDDCSQGEDEQDCSKHVTEYRTTTIPRSSPKPSGTPIGVSTHILNIISKSRFVTGEMTNNCTEFEFECIDGTCIYEIYVCDGFPDCSEGEDEDCSGTFTGTTPKCPDYQYECNDGKCIDKQYVCDGVADCTQGDDEQGCSSIVTGKTTSISPSSPIPMTTTKSPFFPETTTKCSDHEYECNDGKCINKDSVCDGKADCDQGEDEQDCSTPVTGHPTTVVGTTAGCSRNPSLSVSLSICLSICLAFYISLYVRDGYAD